jgi:choline dehydrogenase-like flavoprotein
VLIGRTAPDADVCIVGAGPAGLVLARELGERGRTVVVLESGDHGPDAAADELNDGDAVGDPYAGLRATRHRQVGGTMQRWNTAVGGLAGAKWVPLDPVDVDGRWPIDHAALRPYYERAQRLCALGPYAYDASSWGQQGRTPFQHRGGEIVSRVYQLGSREALLAPTLQRLASSGNATLMTRSTVTRLETTAGGRRVRHAVVAAPDGTLRRVHARRFVLAAGAVENARLLLVSACGDAGHVGQHFTEHPRDTALALAPRSASVYPSLGFYDTYRAADGTMILGRLALAERAVRDLDLLNASATLLPRPRSWVNSASRVLGAVGDAARARGWLPSVAPGWSQHRGPAVAFDGITVLLNLEQRPHPENRVVLGSRRDRFGVPLPVLHWRWTADDHARLVRLRALVARELEALGLGRVHVLGDPAPDPNAHHHAGTTRMHVDPREGVVDADGRAHGVENLYVAGASVFPTAGFANPTLTIVALALRLAEHLDR